MADDKGARPTEPAKPARKAAPKQEDAAKPSAAPAAEPKKPEPEKTASPAVHRAGGHVDRGDGRGWVLEE